MEKKIVSITAKHDIYWEGCDGREEDLICKKGVTYPIEEIFDGEVRFKNNDQKYQLLFINGLNKDFFINYGEDDLSTGSDSDKTVKSNGGSTSYYQLKTVVSKDSIKELPNGNFEINLETGDVIDMLVGGNFDLGNATKALRRIHQASLGKGKEGIDMNYDANKINYFVKDFIRKVELKDEG